jgi:hypothetical protein
VHINQSEGRSFAVFGRFDRDDVLIIVCARFQFDHLAGIVAFTSEFLRRAGIMIVIHQLVVPAFTGMALEHFAILPQFVPIVGDDPARVGVGIIVENHQLHPKLRGKEGKVGAVPVIVVLPEVGTGVDRKANLVGIGVAAQVHVAQETLDVEAVALILICVLSLGVEGQGQENEECRQQTQPRACQWQLTGPLWRLNHGFSLN